MKLSVYASTIPGENLSTEYALVMSGAEAGICYMKDDFNTILNEPRERTLKRAASTVNSGHHSVTGHPHYCLVLENIPKIIAMLLNNEKAYDTSEKSARYTVMKSAGRERELYVKWLANFSELILARYPELDARTVTKLAQENARYFISVFTPSTTMGYTISLRQLNYIIGYAENLLAKETNDPFILRLKPPLEEFAKLLKANFDVPGLRDPVRKTFSLFAERPRVDGWGENYCTSYAGSFAELAQAQRHRTLSYEMAIMDPMSSSSNRYCERVIEHQNTASAVYLYAWKIQNERFYVPPILATDTSLRAEYLADMESVRNDYPQGMLVMINERGTAENFIRKCHERLCGAAQKEICDQTVSTLRSYSLHADNFGRPTNPEVREELHSLIREGSGINLVPKTKCQLGHACPRPCPLGPAHAFDRLV